MSKNVRTCVETLLYVYVRVAIDGSKHLSSQTMVMPGFRLITSSSKEITGSGCKGPLNFCIFKKIETAVF